MWDFSYLGTVTVHTNIPKCFHSRSPKNVFECNLGGGSNLPLLATGEVFPHIQLIGERSELT